MSLPARTFTWSCRTGFTMLEMLVTLAIAALLAGVVAIAIASQVQGAQLRDAVQFIGHTDGLMRAEAMDFGRAGSLRFDLDGRQVIRTVIFADGREVTERQRLPGRIAIVRFWVHDEQQTGTSGVLTIQGSVHGHSPTYALALENQKGERVYLLIAGLTGHMKEVHDARAIEKTLAILKGDDAH